MNSSNIFDILKNIKTDIKNLSQDIDDKNPREKTEEDLNNIHLSFSELTEILSNLQEEDSQKIQGEFWELIQGKETYQQYVNDINAILNDVRARTKKNPAVQQKIEENLPQEVDAPNANALFSDYQQIFSQLGNLINQWQKVGR